MPCRGSSGRADWLFRAVGRHPGLRAGCREGLVASLCLGWSLALGRWVFQELESRSEAQGLCRVGEPARASPALGQRLLRVLPGRVWPHLGRSITASQSPPPLTGNHKALVQTSS